MFEKLPEVLVKNKNFAWQAQFCDFSMVVDMLMGEYDLSATPKMTAQLASEARRSISKSWKRSIISRCRKTRPVPKIYPSGPRPVHGAA